MMHHMSRTLAVRLFGCLLIVAMPGLAGAASAAEGSRLPPASAQTPAPAQPEAGKPTETAPAAKPPMRLLVAPEPKAGEVVTPGRQPECVWLGQRIVSLLWRDDVNTAREQSRFYDVFGCPSDHLKLAFRCVIRQSERQPQQTDLNARIYGCWMSPEIGEPTRQ